MSSFGLPLIALFLSTPSARRATLEVRAVRRVGADFYPRPPRGGRQVCRAEAPAGQIISIHALREEGDTLTVSARIPSTYFYPRPPRGGRREKTGEFIEDKEFLSTPSARRATQGGTLTEDSYEFLSTPSARRATVTQHTSAAWPTYFYPRPPRGGRRCSAAGCAFERVISIHALREEGDGNGVPVHRVQCISIHALREEGDWQMPGQTRVTGYFYPRPPRGGRLADFQRRRCVIPFLSTPSARRATHRAQRPRRR